MKEGQNDYPLGKAVQEMGGYAHCVRDWKDTKVQINNIVCRKGTQFTLAF